MQRVRAVVGGERVPLPVERERRLPDPVRVAADQAAEVRAVGEVAGEARVAQRDVGRAAGPVRREHRDDEAPQVGDRHAGGARSREREELDALAARASCRRASSRCGCRPVLSSRLRGRESARGRGGREGGCGGTRSCGGTSAAESSRRPAPRGGTRPMRRWGPHGRTGRRELRIGAPGLVASGPVRQPGRRLVVAARGGVHVASDLRRQRRRATGQHLARLEETVALKGMPGRLDPAAARAAISRALAAEAHAESRVRLDVRAAAPLRRRGGLRAPAGVALRRTASPA